MNYFPIFLTLKGRKCVLVGGGNVAARKFALLTRAGALVSIVSPVLCEALAEAVAHDRATHIPSPFLPTHLDGAHLVIAATQKREVNQAVAEVAGRSQIPVNVVDSPELCTFIMPAIVDRSPLVVAISSGGNAPVLARRVRTQIEMLLPAGLGDFVSWCGGLRERVRATLAPSKRRAFWERLIDSPAQRELSAGRIEAANRIAEQLLGNTPSTAPGRVSLVGAGPGDPELLTLKGLRALQTADVIVHDRLVPQQIIDLGRRDADRIDVGKSAHRHTMPQAAINRLLVSLAREGKSVCRLKGGDPYIFGRGGEEAELLAASGIEFDVVPGVTAMAGCAAAAGIPLTHRDYSAGIHVITGHRCRGDMLECDWQALARSHQTLVFYMGLSSLDAICERLQTAGAPASRPVAVIERGSTPQQRVVVATIGTIQADVESAKIASPALIVVGEVVALRDKLVDVEAQLRSSTPDVLGAISAPVAAR